MSDENRWSTESYPNRYSDDVNRSIGFSGLDVDLFARGKARSIVETLDRFAPMRAAGADCLDIGCGIGILHPLIAPRVASLSGADVSAEAIATARMANPTIDYRSYEGDRLPYEDASFDFCSTVCVMHHVPPASWPAFVAEAWRVTRPGGLFAVYEHNPINPLTKVAVWRCPFDHDAVLLRARRVIGLLEAQGFEILEKEYLFFVPADADWARRVDRALTWLPLGAQYVVCARRPIEGTSAGPQHHA
jgi:SAM-dependent methyltransferase